jgi:hypothetical protein
MIPRSASSLFLVKVIAIPNFLQECSEFTKSEFEAITDDLKKSAISRIQSSISWFLYVMSEEQPFKTSKF